jgi:hypothetical protein
MKKLHWILTGFTFSLILLSVNRLTDWFLAPISPNDFLRWVDFNTMIPVSILMIVLYYLAKRDVQESAAPEKQKRNLLLTNIVFLVGVYLFGASAGNHEVTNYLSTRFCERGLTESDLCNIINFNDDIFSHVIYYFGVIMMQLSVLWIEFRAPRKTVANRSDIWLIILNALFIAVAIFGNLAFEDTAIDLIGFIIVLLTSGTFLYLRRAQWKSYPFIFYTTAAYMLGIGATLIAKLLTFLR